MNRSPLHIKIPWSYEQAVLLLPPNCHVFSILCDPLTAFQGCPLEKNYQLGNSSVAKVHGHLGFFPILQLIDIKFAGKEPATCSEHSPTPHASKDNLTDSEALILISDILV